MTIKKGLTTSKFTNIIPKSHNIHINGSFINIYRRCFILISLRICYFFLLQ